MTFGHWRWHHYVLSFFGVVIIAILVAYNFYLAGWVKDFLNEELNDIKGYEGEVQEVDIHLYRGAYTIHGLEIRKKGAGIPVPFVNIDTMDLSVEWNALMHGSVVAAVKVDKPILNFAVDPSGTKTQTGKEVNWADKVKKLMPIDFNRVEISNGKIAYRNFSTNPKVNLHIHNLNGAVTNLRNVTDKDHPLPSLVAFKGDSIGKGKLDLKGKMNILADPTEMEMALKLEKVNLPALNEYFEAFAGLNVKSGDLDLYSEFTMHNGDVKGYIKPIATHVSLIDLSKEHNPFQLAWDAVAAAVVDIFTNQRKDQFATKVPFEGHIDQKVNTNGWETVIGILHNAFVQALKKGPDGDLKLIEPLPKKEDVKDIKVDKK